MKIHLTFFFFQGNGENGFVKVTALIPCSEWI